MFKRWRAGFDYMGRGLNGSQGEILLIIGATFMARGGIYLANSQVFDSFPPVLQEFQTYVPWVGIYFWGFLLLVAGIVCCIYAFRFDDSFALAMAAIVYGAWFTAYALGWVMASWNGTTSMDYDISTTYLVLLAVLLFWGGKRKGTTG